MSNYYNQRLLVGNCLDTLKQLADSSIDSVVTDPPYELGFMGKSWDSTGIAFNIAVWQECMRVLKPGGHLLAFSGSRTYHRMAVAIEDAGFEIRDQIMWLYGSGFPKSMAIDKAIDKAAKVERKVIGTDNSKLRPNRKSETEGGERILAGGFKADNGATITEPTTKEAKQWQGWGTALKPAHEPIVVARKPISMKTVAENVLTYGTGAINIDASRVASDITQDPNYRPNASNHNGHGSSFSINGENIRLKNDLPDSGFHNSAGRFPANVIHDGSDEVVELFPDTKGKIAMSQQASTRGLYEGGTSLGDTKINDGITDNGSAARFFYCAKTSKSERNAGLDGLQTKKSGKMMRTANNTSDQQSEGFERFGTKPTANFHPTVKPLTLMRYLIKLVTPPNGTVLDPFLGSGSTAVAAVLDGFNWKGCEMTEDYLPIIKGRVEHAIAEVKKAKQKKESTPTLFEEDKDDN